MKRLRMTGTWQAWSFSDGSWRSIFWTSLQKGNKTTGWWQSHVSGPPPCSQGFRDLSVNHPSQLHHLTECVQQLLPTVFPPFCQILFVFTHMTEKEAVAEPLSYTRFSWGPISVSVVGELVRFAKFLCNSQIPNQVRLLMSDLQNPNLASDSNTLCGFQQVSTPFCFCLPMAKMFICLSQQVFRDNS